MASVGKDANGRKRVLFVAPDGSRRTIRLGKCDIKQAEAFRVKLESLLAARVTGSMDSELARWLRGLPDDVHEKFARAGLAESRSHANASLNSLLDVFFRSLTVKQSTRITYEQTRNSLESHFGKATPLASITPLRAEEFAQTLRSSGIAAATASKRIKTARQVFKSAVTWRMISENPFTHVRAGAQINRARAVFVPREDVQRILEQCPDAQWRLIIALSRFGGLRCPSETLALSWSDIDWNAGSMRVQSTKTEHHEGGHERDCPIFPELLPFLRDAFECAEEGSGYVISRYRQKNANLRSQLERLIAKAKVKQWPRLFHNMRASRQTELAAAFPLADVCKWLGNSPAIAAGHYLQATNANFDAATKSFTGPDPMDPDSRRQHSEERGTESGTRSGRNTAQQAEAGNRTRSHRSSQTIVPYELVLETTTPCTMVQGVSMTPMGFEPMSHP